MSEQPQQTEYGTPGKNKRSSVYVYLAVLFGAAFLMLLLAYFVQQRNNAAVLDDLRSTTASRQELLEEIQRLEDEKSHLSRQADELRQQLKEERDLSGQMQREMSDRISSWSDFWELECAYLENDYESCAAILLLEGFSYRIPESAQARHEEIVQTIISQGLLAEDYMVHVSDYQDLTDAYLERQADR